MTPEKAKPSGLGDMEVTESASGWGEVMGQTPKWEERCGMDGKQDGKQFQGDLWQRETEK